MYIKAIREGYVYVGHNTLGYDHVLLDSLYGISYSIAPDSINQTSVQIIDTLAMSRELWPDRPKHALDWWGERLGIKKPSIDDWAGLSTEEYVHRCQEDVKITGAVFLELCKEADINL